MKKPSASFWITILFGIGLGMCAAVLLPFDADLPPIAYTLALIFRLMMLMLGAYAQIILHEAGHLLFGLRTGYRFLSFRIGNRMIQKTESGYRWYRYTLAGTAGQCLLIPPADPNAPAVLYLLGGGLMNLFTAVLFGVLFACVPLPPLVASFCLGCALFGLFFAVTNLVPMQMGFVLNDGATVRDILRSPLARRCLWTQLAVNAQEAAGVRLKDQPDAWFTLPPDADYHSTNTSAIGVFAENRLMDAYRFADARAQIDFLLGDSVTLIPIYRTLLMLDRIYLDILEKRPPDLSVLQAPDTVAFLKAMRNFPSVLRTQYAVALYRGDEAEQRRLLTQFQSVIAHDPSTASRDSESGLVALLTEN